MISRSSPLTLRLLSRARARIASIALGERPLIPTKVDFFFAIFEVLKTISSGCKGFFSSFLRAVLTYRGGSWRH